MYSLRWKLIGIMSLLVICSSLTVGWLLLDRQITQKYHELQHTGTILVQNLAVVSRYGVLTNDRLRLSQLSDGSLSIDEVVYVVITDIQGRPLVSKRKDTTIPSTSAEIPLHPPLPLLTRNALSASRSEPTITLRTATRGPVNVIEDRSPPTLWSWLFIRPRSGHRVYDFALPIYREPDSSYLLLDPDLAFDFSQNPSADSSSMTISEPLGLIHLGLSVSQFQLELRSLVGQVIAIMFMIILSSIGLSIVISGHMVRPIQALRDRAARMSEGFLIDETNDSLPTPTNDEIGELTQVFNRMTHSMHDRDAKLNRHVDRLEVLRQIGLIYSSNQSLSVLLERVAQLVVDKQHFSRFVALLYDDTEKRLTYGYAVGFSRPLRTWIERFDCLTQKGSFPLLDQVLFDGQDLLISHLDQLEHLLPAHILGLAKKQGVASCVIAPLQEGEHILGIIVAEREHVLSTTDDQAFLRTLGHQLAVVIGKIRAYGDLHTLASTLEHRVLERTLELEQANEKLQEVDRLKSAFVSIASHELRTPLMAIHVFVDNMLKGIGGPVSAKHLAYLSRIQANLQRLRRMIGELLNLSQIESGEMLLTPSQVVFESVVHRAAEDLAPLLEAKALRLHVENESYRTELVADEDKLYQIVTNLLHNAIKFTPDDGDIWISVTANGHDSVQLCVSDSGCGIPTDDQDKIFRPFFRGSANELVSPGAGLGLWVTKRLVELHDGELSFTTTPGCGSIFLVTLPLSLRDQPVVPVP